MRRFSITLPVKMVSENWFARHHWSYRRKEIADLAMLLAASRSELGLPVATTKRRVHATFVFKDRRRRDRSNYAGKVIEDSMVRAGLLVDDSPEWFEWGRVEFEKGPEPAVILEFEDMVDSPGRGGYNSQ